MFEDVANNQVAMTVYGMPPKVRETAAIDLNPEIREFIFGTGGFRPLSYIFRCARPSYLTLTLTLTPAIVSLLLAR